MSRRSLGRLGRRTALAVLVVALVLLLAIVVTARRGDPALHPAKAGEPTVPVYLVYNWMHAALVVPRAPFRGDAGATARALADMDEAPWVSVGWGDHWHYQERGLTPERMRSFARSMLVPDNPSVVALDPVAETPSPETRGRQVVKLALSERGFERLMRRLDASFALTDGRPVRVGRGRSPDSWFFRSGEGSDLAHQCNHWIAELLNAAGVPVTPLVDTFTHGLAWDLRLRAGAVPVPGRPVPPREPETPPVYSGTFRPLAATTRTITGGVTFSAYRIRFGSGEEHATAPERLGPASALFADERPLAEVLRVPPDSLVEVRTVERARRPREVALGVCGSRPPERVALGFRKPRDGPYEIALAAFATPSNASGTRAHLCGVFQYVQP